MGSLLTGRMVVATVAVVAIAAGTGCGSSGGGSESANEQIRSVVNRALTAESPEVCDHLLTNRFLEQSFGEGEGSTLEQCRFESELPGEPFGHVVRFNSLQVTGDHAVADISVTGGQADGSRDRLDLVREAGDWKLDYFADVQIDQAKFDAAGRRGLIALGVNGQEADCAVKRVDRFYDTDAIEKAIVAGKTHGFTLAQVVCFSRKTLVHEFTLAVHHSVSTEVPRPILDCVIRKITVATSTAELRVLFAAPEKFAGYFHDETQTAAKACAKESQAGLLPAPAPS